MFKLFHVERKYLLFCMLHCSHCSAKVQKRIGIMQIIMLIFVNVEISMTLSSCKLIYVNKIRPSSQTDVSRTKNNSMKKLFTDCNH